MVSTVHGAQPGTQRAAIPITIVNVEVTSPQRWWYGFLAIFFSMMVPVRGGIWRQCCGARWAHVVMNLSTHHHHAQHITLRLFLGYVGWRRWQRLWRHLSIGADRICGNTLRNQETTYLWQTVCGNSKAVGHLILDLVPGRRMLIVLLDPFTNGLTSTRARRVGRRHVELVSSLLSYVPVFIQDMIFTLKPYRAFATLVGLFLLVGQVVAVPPTANSQGSRRLTVQHLPAEYINLGTRSYDRGAITARFAAKREHKAAAKVNRALVRKHTQYAQGLAQPYKDLHLEVAEDHRARHKYHKQEARIHNRHAEAQLRLKSTVSRSKEYAYGEAQKARLRYKHAKMLNSAMTAAKNHRMAATIHREAGKLAVGVRNSAAVDRHRQLRLEHDKEAFNHAKFAVENTTPVKPIGHTTAEGIARFDQSANDAKLSMKGAHASIQRTMAAATKV